MKGGALLAEKVTAKVTKAEFEAVAKASTDRPPLTSNNVGDFSGELDAKAIPSGLASGETGVVGTGKAAANDASFDGEKATATTGEVVATEATSANAQAALRAKLSGLQKAQETAAVTRTLPDGRIRYYTQEVPARTEGPTRGASFATEFDPKTGSTRQ